MIGASKRLLPAGLLALAMHGAFLSWQLGKKQVVRPTALPIQSIAVSLGARPRAQEPPAPVKKLDEPVEQKVVEPAVIAEPEVVESPPQVPPRPKPVALAKQQIPPVPLVKEQPAKVISPPVAAPPPAHSTARENTEPPVAEPGVGDDSSKANSAAIIQQAAPLYQVNPPPKYPRLARRRGLQGVVLLEAFIDVSGRVADLRLFTSSGHSSLDRAALKAVQRWRFSPGTIGGTSQEMWVKVPVRFVLH